MARQRGGVWRCTYPDGAIIYGEFIALNPLESPMYTWGFERTSHQQNYDWVRPNFTPPGHSLIRIHLIAQGDGTLARLRQTDFQPGEPLEDGWNYFFNILETVIVSHSAMNDAIVQVALEPTCRAILHLVTERELPSSEIAGHFDISPAAVSQHLKQLREAGLVNMRGDGTRRLFSADQELHATKV